jgi:hypothetical protein
MAEALKLEGPVKWTHYKVRSCWHCQMGALPLIGEVWCQGVKPSVHVLVGNPPPDWCPLRTGPLVITLDEAAP